MVDEMRYGYARVSTEEQSLARQRSALDAAGCDQIIEEVQSGVKARHRLDRATGRGRAVCDRTGPPGPQHGRGDRHDGRADPPGRGAAGARPPLPGHHHEQRAVDRRHSGQQIAEARAYGVSDKTLRATLARARPTIRG